MPECLPPAPPSRPQQAPFIAIDAGQTPDCPGARAPHPLDAGVQTAWPSPGGCQIGNRAHGPTGVAAFSISAGGGRRRPAGKRSKPPFPIKNGPVPEFPQQGVTAGAEGCGPADSKIPRAGIHQPPSKASGLNATASRRGQCTVQRVSMAGFEATAPSPCAWVMPAPTGARPSSRKAPLRRLCGRGARAMANSLNRGAQTFGRHCRAQARPSGQRWAPAVAGAPGFGKKAPRFFFHRGQPSRDRHRADRWVVNTGAG